MSAATETVTGGAELDRFLQGLPVNLEKNVLRAGMRAGAAVLKPEVQARIPVDHGDLRASVRITSRARRGSVSASVKIGNRKVYYAAMVEYGTRAHVIAVDDQDRRINRRTGRQVSISTVNRHLRLGLRLVGPSVQHPGAQPHPYARPAAEAGFTAAVAAVKAKVRERLTPHGLVTPAPIPSDPEE